MQFDANGQPVLPEVSEQLGDEYTLYGLIKRIEADLSHHNIAGERVKVRAKVGIGWHGGLVLSTEEHPGAVDVEFEVVGVGFGKYLPHVD